MLALTIFVCAAAHITLVLGAPAPFKATGATYAISGERRQIRHVDVLQIRHSENASKAAAAVVTKTVTVLASNATACATTTPAEGDVEEEKTKSNGTLGTAVTLKGNNELQAVAFAGSSGVGAMEIEYQNVNERTLTVVENKTPGTAPIGFTFADTSSYQVTLAEGAANITRQQIDYVFNLNNPTVKAATNLSAVRTGKFCADAKGFVISDALGEQDFEADEGESTFKVDNIVGEWALFLPTV